jgi:hypothetical protein
VPIDQVPLVTDINGFPAGSIVADVNDGAPWFFICQKNSTITAIVPDHADGILWVAVTSSDKGITKIHYADGMMNFPDRPLMPLTWPDRIDGGATFWWAITDHTQIWLGKTILIGLQNLVGQLQMGITEPYACPGLSAGWGHGVTSTEAAANMASWTRLKQSVGHAYPRTDHRFTFYATSFWMP